MCSLPLLISYYYFFLCHLYCFFLKCHPIFDLFFIKVFFIEHVLAVIKSCPGTKRQQFFLLYCRIRSKTFLIETIFLHRFLLCTRNFELTQESKKIEFPKFWTRKICAFLNKIWKKNHYYWSHWNSFRYFNIYREGWYWRWGEVPTAILILFNNPIDHCQPLYLFVLPLPLLVQGFVLKSSNFCLFWIWYL